MATVNIANISQLAPSRSDNAQVGISSSPPSATVFNEAFSKAHQQLHHSAVKSGNSMPSRASMRQPSEPSSPSNKVISKGTEQIPRSSSGEHIKNTSNSDRQQSKTVGSKHNSRGKASVSAENDYRQGSSGQDSDKVSKNNKDVNSAQDDKVKPAQQQVAAQDVRVKSAEKTSTDDSPVSSKNDSSSMVSKDESKVMQLLSRLEKSQNADMQLEQASSVSDKLKIAMQVLEQAKKLSASKQLQSEDGKLPHALELALMMLQKVQNGEAQVHRDDMTKSSDVSSVQLHQTLQMLNQAIAQSKGGKSYYAEHLNQLDPKLREGLEQLSLVLTQVSSMDGSSHTDKSTDQLNDQLKIEGASKAEHHSDDDISLLDQIQIQLASLLDLPAVENTQPNDRSSSLHSEQSSIAKSGSANKIVKNIALLALAELKLQHAQQTKPQGATHTPDNDQNDKILADKIAVLTKQLAHLVVSDKKEIKDTPPEALRVHSQSQAAIAQVQHKDAISNNMHSLVQPVKADESELMLNHEESAKKSVYTGQSTHSLAVKASISSQPKTSVAQSVQQALTQNSAQGTDSKTNSSNLIHQGQAIKGDEQAAMIAVAQSSDPQLHKKEGHQQHSHSNQFGTSHLVNSEISLSAGQQHSGLGAQGQHQGGAQLGINTPQPTVSKSDGSFASQLAMNQPSKLSGELNERINYMVSNRLHSADIRLDPAHLGAMQIRLNLHHDQAQVQIHVHNPQAREMLEQSMPKLRDMLAQQGIQLGQSQINHGNSGNSSQQGFAQTGGQSQGGFAGQQPFGHSASEVVAEESLPHLLHSQLSTDDSIDYYA